MKVTVAVLFIFINLSAGHAAVAQNPSRVASVLSVTVKPGHATQYETHVVRLIEAHDKLSSGAKWTGYSTEFGRSNDYLFVSMQANWGGLDEDEPDVLAEVLGPTEARQFSRSMGMTVAAVSRGAWLERLDLSYAPDEESEPPSLVGLMRARVKAYGNTPYEQYLRMVRRATRETTPEVRYVVFSPSFGAANTYLFLSGFGKYDDLVQALPVPERLIAAFGQDQADRLLAQRDALVLEQSVVMMRVRKDLSR